MLIPHVLLNNDNFGNYIEWGTQRRTNRFGLASVLDKRGKINSLLNPYEICELCNAHTLWGSSTLIVSVQVRETQQPHTWTDDDSGRHCSPAEIFLHVTLIPGKPGGHLLDGVCRPSCLSNGQIVYSLLLPWPRCSCLFVLPVPSSKWVNSSHVNTFRLHFNNSLGREQMLYLHPEFIAIKIQLIVLVFYWARPGSP